MQSQYLIVAENITFKNNKLSCINIYEQFLAIKLPAEFSFDMAVICGPGWDVGEYDLNIDIKINESEETTQLGTIKVNIPTENFVYNAMATDLKVKLGSDIKSMTFLIRKNDELILERAYPVNTLLVKKEQTEQPQEQPQQN